MMHTTFTMPPSLPVQGQRTASNWPAFHQASRHAVPLHTHQQTPTASALKQGKAAIHRQRAAAMAAESGPQYAMHGQSLRHALKGGQQGGRAAALGDSSGREEQSVGGRDVQSDLASAVPAGAFQIGPEPEPSTSKVSGSSQQGLRASQKMDAESRVSEWQQKSGIDVDHRPLWGTFMKGVGLLVLWFRELGKSIREPFAVLEELTYPDPRGILRLTFIVLAATAVLTALVWSIDRTFAALLFPPVARRLCQGASLRGL